MVAKHEPEPLEHRNSNVPLALAELIRRMMRKSVDERTQSAADLAIDLKRIATTIPA